MNIKKIVEESVSSYIRGVINEDMDLNLDPKIEFINGLKLNNIELSFGDNNDFEFETDNFFFHVDYKIESSAYYDEYSSNDGSFEDEYTIHDDDIEFSDLSIGYSSIDDDDELIDMEVDDEIENAMKECQVNWDEYDMESYEDRHFGEYDEEF